MKYRILPAILFASSVVMLGIGCNPLRQAQQKVEQKIAEGVTEKAIEGASGGKVAVDLKGDDGVVMRDNKTGDVVAFGADIKIPDDFPKAVPRYDGAKATSMSIDGAGKGATISLMTSDSIATAVEWYGARMKADGWTESQSFTAGTVETRTYEKGNNSLTLSISKSTDGDNKDQTVIYIAYSVEQGN